MFIIGHDQVKFESRYDAVLLDKVRSDKYKFEVSCRMLESRQVMRKYGINDLNWSKRKVDLGIRCLLDLAYSMEMAQVFSEAMGIQLLCIAYYIDLEGFDSSFVNLFENWCLKNQMSLSIKL